MCVCACVCACLCVLAKFVLTVFYSSLCDGLCAPIHIFALKADFISRCLNAPAVCVNRSAWRQGYGRTAWPLWTGRYER